MQIHKFYNRGNVVKCCAFTFFGGPSFLQVTRAALKAWMSLNFGQNPSPITELATLECLNQSYNVMTALAPTF